MFTLQFSHIARHLLPIAALATFVTLTSCRDEDFDSPMSNGRVISFSISDSGGLSRSTAAVAEHVSLATVTLESETQQLYLIPEVTDAPTSNNNSRAEAVTKTNISDFGVYASAGDASGKYYMENVEVTKENSWTPRKQYLWPGSGSLHINAYSPYRAIAESNEGITSLPSPETGETPRIAYTVPSDVTEQSDLMWATPHDASASPCAMEFNHALAGVRFVAGKELTPCIVKSITLSGLRGSGTLDIESGLWSETSGHESYTVSPDIALEAADGGEYVVEGTVITENSYTFMLLPQSLGEDATITITIEYNGEELHYTASLQGQLWEAGRTYTYHLSANPTLDRYIITVSSPLSFNYTGGSGSFPVKSIHEEIRNGELITSEVPWIAEFIDEDGNVVNTPKWISSMTMSGDGSMECRTTTQMVEPVFVQMSAPTRQLRQNSAVGSADMPYNLANSTGAQTVENTANSYIINAPGIYSIPLVYGNAIKDGADNTAAYAPTRSSAPFVNHLGNRIKHPYISDNEGCADISGAKLIWEGRLNMIHDLHLSSDGKSLVFEIPRAYIRQGNAVVGITDASGDIMWSWQLWVTDYVAGTQMSHLTYNGTPFEIMPYNMGYVVGGDETDFASSNALVRFTQTPANGASGSSVTVAIQQTGKHIITPDCYSFYQWGRKDPMISAIKEWYYDDHTEITSIDTRIVPVTGSKVDADFEALCVKNPQVFWTSPTGEPTFSYTNNWNVGSATHRVKTVYDPCPPGFMVPGNEFIAFRDMGANNYSFITSGGISEPAGFNVTCPDGTSTFFPALGYRSGSSGNETVADASGGDLTSLWTSHANTREAGALIITHDKDVIRYQLPSDPRLEAFAVRPILE